MRTFDDFFFSFNGCPLIISRIPSNLPVFSHYTNMLFFDSHHFLNESEAVSSPATRVKPIDLFSRNVTHDVITIYHQQPLPSYLCNSTIDHPAGLTVSIATVPKDGAVSLALKTLMSAGVNLVSMAASVMMGKRIIDSRMTSLTLDNRSRPLTVAY